LVKRIGRKMRVSWLHGWGKVRRFCLAALRPGQVKMSKERRRGECIRCGACCRLIFKCPALYYLDDGTAACRYHQLRPMNCRVFPIDERDIADRDMVMPERPCGFHFVPGREAGRSVSRAAGS
jgi:hypothetical protein